MGFIPCKKNYDDLCEVCLREIRALAYLIEGEDEENRPFPHEDDARERAEGSGMFCGGDRCENPPVWAEVHSDDRVHEVRFDAAPWFKDEETTDQEIFDLAGCEFGGDYPADYVAEYFEDINDAIGALMGHTQRMHEVGFECHVDGDAAMRWLRINRPYVAKRIGEMMDRRDG